MQLKSNRMYCPTSSGRLDVGHRPLLKISWFRELLTAGIVAAWLIILTQIALLSEVGSLNSFGLGMGMLNELHFELNGASSRFGELILSLCVPSQSLPFLSALLTAFSMWMLMVFAMMVPAIMSFYDPQKAYAKPISQLVFFAVGFLLIWSLCSLGAAALQVVLQRNEYLTENFVLSDWRLGLTMIIFAICYPFSPVGRRNNSHCNRLLRMLNNSHCLTRPFRAGLNMGVKCVCCCWPMLMAMFAFGIMNVFAMATFTAMLVYQRRQKDLLA